MAARDLKGSFNRASGKSAAEGQQRTDNSQSTGLGDGPKVAKNDELGRNLAASKRDALEKRSAKDGAKIHEKTLQKSKKNDGPSL